MRGSKQESLDSVSSGSFLGLGTQGRSSHERSDTHATRPTTPEFNWADSNEKKPTQRLRHMESEVNCEREIAQIMYGAKHSLFVTAILGLRVIPAALASYYNFLFSTAFNNRLFGDGSKTALFLSYLVWLDNGAINTISLGKSGERIIQDLFYQTDKGQSQYFAQAGKNRTYIFMTLAALGSIPNLKMVYDAMSARPDLAYLTIPMTICQGLASAGSNYRGLLGFAGTLYPGEANKYREYTQELVKVIAHNYRDSKGNQLDDDVVKELLKGKVTRDSFGKYILKIIMTILSLPYAFVSFLAAFGFFTYHTSNQVVAALVSFVQVSIAVLGMTMKALLLNKSNYSIIEAIWPNNQLIPSTQVLSTRQVAKQRLMAVLSFVVGSLTLGGAAEGVKKYLLDHFMGNEQMLLKMGLSYLIAFAAAGGINMKDFYDLFMVEVPGTIHWWQELLSENEDSTKVKSINRLDFLGKTLNVEPNTGLAIFGKPGRPTIECRSKPEFKALLSSLNDSGQDDYVGLIESQNRRKTSFV